VGHDVTVVLRGTSLSAVLHPGEAQAAAVSPVQGRVGAASITGGCGGPCSTQLCAGAAATPMSAPPPTGYAATGALARQRLTYESSL